ncbi:hypothetical protein ACHAXA_011879 [Cyclostephanos tholiformis]|uniref:VASt domain-containing protein n=1 Tax=Cyclostephanos tholiformis TaxID=382380 RepID=A0ABD3SCH9_9STRA
MPGKVAPITTTTTPLPRAEEACASSPEYPGCDAICNFLIDIVLGGCFGTTTPEHADGNHKEGRARSQLSYCAGLAGDGLSRTQSVYALNCHRGGGGSVNERERLETVILPRLRFNPRPSAATSSSSSSLRDFFDTFLADDAPHSFRLFHESNGDEDVDTTPWRDVDEVRSERTITFRAKINPGSSSNPLSPQSERSNNCNNSNNATVIPLKVTIFQSLVKRSETWVLECEFSFDFHSQHSADASAPSPSNHSNSVVGGGMGKRLGSGLGQFFMSNVVKGTTVNVAVILRECGDDDSDRDGPATTTNAARDPNGGDVDDGDDTVGVSQKFCHDATLSCLVHPLLLPIGGIRGHSGTSVGRRRDGRSEDDDVLFSACVTEEGPSRIGASLLSAIKARNAPCCIDLDGPSVPDTSLAGVPIDDRPNGPSFKNSWSAEQSGEEKRHQRTQEDVLRCSSIGSLRCKNAPSFDVSRSPSTTAMRRMILERRDHSTVESTNAPCAIGTSDAHVVPSAQRAPSSSSRQSRGLSMRIEMELVGGNGNSSNSSSLSSSFSRSASISTIDDKIRRGLRKRVARSWISWAESWCMRLWEDDEIERARRKALGVGPRQDYTSRRSRVNVRPSVRRIGDPVVRSSDAMSSTATPPPKYAWEKLHLVGDDAGHRIERWMSSEQEGECGVEVTCTTKRAPAFGKQSRSPSLAMANRPRRRGGTSKTPRKRSLLSNLAGTL